MMGTPTLVSACECVQLRGRALLFVIRSHDHAQPHTCAQGNVESHGLSLLDIVRHAVSTIIETLGPDDRLSVVSYSNTAKVVLPLTKMDEKVCVLLIEFRCFQQ